ncbi:baseplate wedge protein [Vibrio phage vB_VhaM_VH-8]|nr:baseplate wedge protein [Vibrio phage vB_VhaM_VH-8]
MTTPISLDYLSEYYQLQPSLFRESDNLHRLFQAIFEVYATQQDDLLWLSQNILNIDVAEKWHLDFIGNLVGQDRFLIGFNAETYFGFEGAYKSDTFGASGAPYVGGYWNSRSYFNAATARRLSDDEYRRIIKARIISNHSNCSSNDLLEVINLITNRTDNTIQTIQHGIITVKSKDETGLLSYFVDNIDTKANILPVAAGVRLNLGYIEGEDYFGEEMTEFLNLLERLVNVDLPSAIGDIK